MISGDLWAGAEVQALALLAALRAAGVEVMAAVLNEGELTRRLREQGIAVAVFPESDMSALDIAAGLRRLLREWRPDIVHTHRTKENILGTFANRLALNAPSVRTVHGADEHRPKGLRQLPKRALNALNRWCGARLQQRIIAVTPELAAKLSAEFERGKIAVIDNGIDIEAVRAQSRLPPPPAFAGAAIHVGIVGRLAPVKRVDLFLEIAALLQRQRAERPWHFHVIGDGPLRESLNERAAALGLDAVTTFHGHRNDSAACIGALDILVMCSDHEGLPMTLLEAMALGTRIVGHDVGGIAQLLREGRNGWPVASQQPAAYVSAILVAYPDRPDNTARIDAARGEADNYSSSRCALRHIELYRQLLAGTEAGY